MAAFLTRESGDFYQISEGVTRMPIPTKPPGCNGIMPPGIPE
jgi:hypothetical protein